MRKLLLSLALLVAGAMSVWAQVVADGVYTLSADENKQRGELVAAENYNYPVLDGIDLSGYTENSTAAKANGQYWYVQSADASSNTYYIYNIAQRKYLVNENGNVNFGDTPYEWTFVTNTSKPDYLNIKDAAKTGNSIWLSSGCGRTAEQRPVQWDSNNNDGGALYTFTYIGNYFATPETDKYYKIKGDGELPWLTANTTAGGNVVVSANEADAAVFLKTANGLQAVATGKYLGYSGGKYTYSDTELTIELRNTGDYLANYSNKYAIVSGGNYMFNNNNDGIVHESNGQLDLPRLWAFTVVEAKIGDTYYATFEDAMAAEGDGDVELLVEKAITLDDDNAYTYTKGAYDVDVEYSRNLIPGIWNPVYIPFDATVLAAEFEVAEFTAAEGTTITLTKLKANDDGDIELSANTAYVVRPIDGNNPLSLGAWGYIHSNEEEPLPLGENGFFIRGNYSVLAGSELGEYDRIVSKDGQWAPLAGTSTLKPFRLILTIPAGVDASAISMRVEDEDTTSIETLETMTEVTIYDLMGRRVETMTEGGIYIVNGKKVIR